MRAWFLRLAVLCVFFGLKTSWAESPIGEIFNVYRNLDLGDPEMPTEKDYYVNIGSSDGVKLGSHLTVVRKASSSDALTQKFYQDLVFPIATLKVIHLQKKVAITRLIKMYPLKSSPVISPYALMVGDSVVIK